MCFTNRNAHVKNAQKNWIIRLDNKTFYSTFSEINVCNELKIIWVYNTYTVAWYGARMTRYINVEVETVITALATKKYSFTSKCKMQL